jgi:ABC-type glycerol-3-phosphate transport system substrate-binding protein
MPSQDEFELVLEIVDNDVAYDTLATQIAAGNAPDIVGPLVFAAVTASLAPGWICNPTSTSMTMT